MEYLQLIVDYKLNQELSSQLQALQSGFSSVISPLDLQLLTADELSKILCGGTHLSITELSEWCQLTQGYTTDAATIQLLWQVLRSFGEDKQAAFMQFVTGSSRVPAGGVKELNPPFTIQLVRDTANLPEAWKLPSASTCFNLLKLPPYEDFEMLESKLSLSVLEGSVGFAFS